MLTGIIGGGLAGVSLRYFVEHDCEVLEKEECLGGLCRTFHVDGFSYDIGGHILFSRDRTIMKVIQGALGSNAGHRRRNNKILFKGRYLKYPFENGLAGLDNEDNFECLMGYIENQHREPENFEEWIFHVFGDGIAEKYLVPYNRKIWKYPLDRISLDWVERVPRPPLEDVVKSALGIETEGNLHQLNFIYPVVGGIESLVRAFAGDGEGIVSGYEVVEVRKVGAEWLVRGSGNEKLYDRLVVTVPVKEAVRFMPDVPQEVVRAADSLVHNSVRVVLVGLKDDSLPEMSAVYIPDRTVIPHRVCSMGYFSGSMVPEGKSALIAEVTAPRGHDLYKIPDDLLAEKVVGDLHRAGVIEESAIEVTDVKSIEYGYVIDDLDRAKNMRIVKEFFESQGVVLHGRFAEWEYINMDEVVRRSAELARRLDAERGAPGSRNATNNG